MKPMLARQTPLTPSAEGLDLARVWSRCFDAKDPVARETLLKHYAPLVRQLVGRMKIRFIQSLDRDDLESMGAVGLIKAVDRFNPHMNVKFETFAYRWIQGQVLDYVRSLDALSRTSRERLSKFKANYRQLRDSLGHDPSEHEIAEALHLSSEELASLYTDMGHCESLSLSGRAEHEDSDENWEDSFADIKEKSPQSVLERQETLDQIKEVLETLPEKERLVMSLYYYDELTLKEIGELLNLSESRVCQLHSKAVMRFRECLSPIS